jgi:HlyD family secretion protein
MTMNKWVVVIVVLLAIAAGAGYWWFATDGESIRAQLPQPNAQATDIVGSGTIEADQIAITSQLGGRITDIKVDEGDEVQAGELLLQLDTTDYLAQQRELEAALAAANANLDEVESGPRPEEIAIAEAKLQEAIAAEKAADAVWQQAKILAANPQELETQLDQMNGQLAIAESDVEGAETQLKMAEIDRDEALRNQSNHAALTQQEIAQKQVDAASAQLQMAQTQRDGVKENVQQMEKMVSFPVQLIVLANQAGASYHLTQAGIVIAEANLAVASAGPRQEEIDVAAAQVQQAEAALAKVQVYLDLLTLTAPQQGVVSQRPCQVGELAAPGAELLTLADLEQVKLTVYIPETQIGRVQEGQTAHVYIDAYPDQVFEGTVSYIAPEAEFTPKNVQTKEERVNLVFAVKIRLDNPNHRLRPGMPADAHILSGL